MNQPNQQLQQINYVPSPGNRAQVIGHVQHHQTSTSMTTLISQPGQSPQYYVATPQQQQQTQQYYIQPQPGQMQTRIVTYETAAQTQHQIQPGQRTIVLQNQPPRLIQQPTQVRHVLQQQQPQQTVRMVPNVVRMAAPRPNQVTITSTPRGSVTPRPARAPRPRMPRSAPAATRIRMIPPGVQQLQLTPRTTYQVVQQRATTPVQRGIQSTPNRILIASPTRVQSPVGQQTSTQQRVVLKAGNSVNQYLVVNPTTPVPAQASPLKAKPVTQKNSDDPDDIESSIPGAVVSRKSDPEPEEQVHLTTGEIISGTEYRQRYQGKRAILKNKSTEIITPQPKEEEVKERESAKMLVILSSGEQRLITFTLPKESCTVQELLEQVGVPFSADSNIQCISNPGADIDYVVTVGVTVDSNELMAVAENTMKQPQVQAQVQAQMQQHQQAQALHQAQVQAAQAAQQQQQQMPQLHNVPPQKLLLHQQQVPQLTDPEEPKSKFVKGYLAVCNHCGTTSMDHARCQRCKREFKGDVKVIRMPANQSSPQRQPQQSTAKLTLVKAPLDLQKYTGTTMFAAKAEVVGKQFRQGRPRGPRKAAKQEEPIVLTLSSDEDDTNDGGNSNKEAGNSSQKVAAVQEDEMLPFEIDVNTLEDVVFSKYQLISSLSRL